MIDLKNILLIGGLMLYATGLKAQENKSPNIIFFLVDDMGWQDTSVPFWDSITPANKKFRTPNLERLAREGVKLTNAYAASVCTPSRISWMTGMNAARHRVTNWTFAKDTPTDQMDDNILEPPAWNVNGLGSDPDLKNSVLATTLPSLLSDAGYHTIHCGKAHFGAIGTSGADPLNLGFVKNIGGGGAGQPATYFSERNYGNEPGKDNPRAVPGMEKYWNSHLFLTKALTREAILAMDTATLLDKPFFLYMSQFAVHLPFEADPEFVNAYLKEGLEKPEAAYAALIEGMDKSLGDLMDYLEKNDLDKNTIIVFMSDNGGYTRSPRSGVEDTQNYPLRAGKGSLYEGGIRVPMLVKWPGIIPPYSVQNTYTIIEDLFPTFLEMAGISHYKTIQKRDGHSMVPYLRSPDKNARRRTLIWNYPNKWYRGPAGITSYVSAIRYGDWKMIYFGKEGRLELYNLKNDIGETRDLSGSEPAKLKKMARLLTKTLKNRKAQLAIYKNSDTSIPYPSDIMSKKNL